MVNKKLFYLLILSSNKSPKKLIYSIFIRDSRIAPEKNICEEKSNFTSGNQNFVWLKSPEKFYRYLSECKLIDK